MTYRIAIQPDYIRHRNGEEQSFSARWLELAKESGVEALSVDVGAPEFLARLADCDGFMWRFGYDPVSLRHAKRVLPAIEHGMKMPVFPSWTSAWHFEDKIAQHYLMQAAGIPTPRTWVWWDRRAALAFCESAHYPLVAKLTSGYQSNNVRLLRSLAEARDLVDQMFGSGVTSLEQRGRLRKMLRHRIQALRLLAGKPLPGDIQHGYLYLQEFLSGNPFDTRVTVIGDRAFAFRRLNRPGDFRASGSGRLEWDPSQIDPQAIRIAFRIARDLNTQSVAIDVLRRGDELVVCEISYTYASWAVRDCPGHWVLRGDPDTGTSTWTEGKMRPEDAIFQDFMQAVVQHDTTGAAAVKVAR